MPSGPDLPQARKHFLLYPVGRPRPIHLNVNVNSNQVTPHDPTSRMAAKGDSRGFYVKSKEKFLMFSKVFLYMFSGLLSEPLACLSGC